MFDQMSPDVSLKSLEFLSWHQLNSYLGSIKVDLSNGESSGEITFEESDSPLVDFYNLSLYDINEPFYYDPEQPIRSVEGYSNPSTSGYIGILKFMDGQKNELYA